MFFLSLSFLSPSWFLLSYFRASLTSRAFPRNIRFCNPKISLSLPLSLVTRTSDFVALWNASTARVHGTFHAVTRAWARIYHAVTLASSNKLQLNSIITGTVTGRGKFLRREAICNFTFRECFLISCRNIDNVNTAIKKYSLIMIHFFVKI